MGFAIGAYRAVEHLGAGPGHRASPFWRAEDARSLEDVGLTVLPVESAESVRDFVEAARDIRHPHLLPVSDLVEDQSRLALVSPWPRGGRLTELVRRRGTLSVGETVTVLLPVAAALDALHRHQVRHGWVCPEALWFDARGRPLLGATAVGLAVADVAGVAALGCADIAPEVLRQARTGPAGTPADVFSLASVALFCLTGRSAWPADEPADVLVQSAAGQWPDLPDDAGPAELIALVRSMLRPDPAGRPPAGAVVDRLSVGGPLAPAPIRFGVGPCPTPASSKRWRGWADLTEPPAQQVAAERPGDAAAVDAVQVDAAEVEPAPKLAAGYPECDETGSDDVPSPQGGPDGVEQEVDGAGGVDGADATVVSSPTRRGPVARLVVAMLCGLLLTVLVAQVGQWVGDPPAESVTEAGPDTSADWTRVVAELDLARSRALEGSDPALLDQVYLPGSAAADADAALVEGLADRGLRVVDGSHDIVSVQVLESGGDPQVTRLAVVDTLAARPVVDVQGQQVAATAARGEQRRVLVLTATEAGYRISAIEPG